MQAELQDEGTRGGVHVTRVAEVSGRGLPVSAPAWRKL